jgi:hypothetical protein
MRRPFFSLVVFFLGVVLLSPVSAEELVISGNSADTQNSIILNSGFSVVNPQSNSFEAITNVDAQADTGGNSASQNNGDVSIITGDAVVNVSVTNQGNQNIFGPQVYATPTSILAPTSVPGPTRSNPSISSFQGSSSSSGSSGGIGGAPIFGLSATSGTPELLTSVTATLGLICLSFALAFLRADPFFNFARA